MSCILDKSIAFDCSALPQGGLEASVIQINYEDWRAAKLAGGVVLTNGVITAITLPTGKQGYKYEVPKGSNIVATSPLRQVDGIDGYDHSVQVRVATIDQLDREELSKMRFNKIVTIVTLSEGRSQVYGDNVGLRLSEYDSSMGDAGTSGTVNFTAMTDSREAPEVQIPINIDATVDLSTLLIPQV